MSWAWANMASTATTGVDIWYIFASIFMGMVGFGGLLFMALES